jgi:hypothetical protein
MGFSPSVSLGWPETLILLISASQVARVTGISHWCSAGYFYYFVISQVCK